VAVGAEPLDLVQYLSEPGLERPGLRILGVMLAQECLCRRQVDPAGAGIRCVPISNATEIVRAPRRDCPDRDS
jgi:hypothetical protein